MPLRPAGPPQHVAITGGSSGIGAALARHYAAAGAALSLTGRSGDRLAAVAAECRDRGSPSVETAVLDVNDAAGMHTWLLARDDARPVDLVIANAGIGGADSLTGLGGGTAESTRAIFATNILGVVNTVAPLVPRFLERRRGQLGLMASLAAFVGIPQAPAYSASKAAVRTYGDGLRRLYGSHGIAVSVICPGFIETPMTDSLPYKVRPIWPVDRAAAVIAAGLARGKRTIAFPLSLHWGARIANLIPAALVDLALRRGP